MTDDKKKTSCEPPTKRAGVYLNSYLEKLRGGTLPQLYPQYETLEGLEVGGGLLTTIAGPPGAGKTALALQVMFDALSLDPNLRVVVANAEMSFETLVQRQWVRSTRISSDAIRLATLPNCS